MKTTVINATQATITIVGPGGGAISLAGDADYWKRAGLELGDIVRRSFETTALGQARAEIAIEIARQARGRVLEELQAIYKMVNDLEQHDARTVDPKYVPILGALQRLINYVEAAYPEASS